MLESSDVPVENLHQPRTQGETCQAYLGLESPYSVPLGIAGPLVRFTDVVMLIDHNSQTSDE